MEGLTEGEVIKADNAILYFTGTGNKVWLAAQNQPCGGSSSSRNSDLVYMGP